VGRIVVTGPLDDSSVELLGAVGEVTIAPDPEERTLLGLAPDAVAIVARGGHAVTDGVIDAAPGLRVVARTGVGVDAVDLAAATARGIPVVVTPDLGAQAVAEGTMAMLLALAKQLPRLDRCVRDDRWDERDRIEVLDLEGATLGVVGLGRIGRRVAALGGAFGMRVLADDPYAETGDADDLRLVDRATLFESSVFITLHAPLNEETRGMVDGELLAKVGPGAVLVNLARGALVASLDDLAHCLADGRLRGIGLDVFAEEPPSTSHPLFRDPRVLLSPHVLGLSRRARHELFLAAARGVVAVLRGERPAAVANPEVL
jgi:D-3-phosphoglycerate dehydrogenase / 2-oxoglutarate reductase